jgi:hypothetical protein
MKTTKKNAAAVSLGRKGGRVSSPEKTAANTIKSRLYWAERKAAKTNPGHAPG